MIYGVTKTDDIRELRARGKELCIQGKYKDHLRLDEYENLMTLMTKVDVAYSKTSYASLCLIKLPAKHFYRDAEAEGYDPNEVPFCEAVGLKVLACGENCYDQIFNDPAALAEWREVLPDIEILDENGAGTGNFEIQRWIEIDAPVRN